MKFYRNATALMAALLGFLSLAGRAQAMCIDGTTAQCTVNGHPGTRECVNGRWTACTADPTPDPSCARQATATLDACQ